VGIGASVQMGASVTAGHVGTGTSVGIGASVQTTESVGTGPGAVGSHSVSIADAQAPSLVISPG
jgi:hypothetical protein